MRLTGYISPVLVAAFILVMLAGCQGTPETVDIQQPTDYASTENEEETLVSDDLGKMDFDGYVFRVLTGIHSTYPVSTFSVEEQTGDLLNDALYLRNRKIEERFNILFKETVLDDIFHVNDNLRKTVQSNDDAYELIMQIDRFALVAAMEGQLISYNDLPNINLSKPYWNQNAKVDYTINSKLFFTYGDDNLVFFGSTTVLAFNKNMLQDLRLDSPYELVYQGKWTFDRYHEMCKAAVSDLNGDGKMNAEDRYGAIISVNMYYPNFWLQDGYKLVEKDKDDLPYFNVPGNDGLLSLMIDLFNKSKDDNLIYDLDTKNDWQAKYSSGHSYNSVMLMFSDGKSLFASTSLINIMDMRAMLDDFGILSYPKSEETFPGDIYGSRTFGGFPYVVPVTVSDTNMVSAIMEVLACESHNIVIPVLYDKVLKVKNTRDKESEKMLDMIRLKRITDLAEVYFWDDVEFVYESMYRGKTADFASKTASIEKKVNMTLSKTIEFFRNLK